MRAPAARHLVPDKDDPFNEFVNRDINAQVPDFGATLDAQLGLDPSGDHAA